MWSSSGGLATARHGMSGVGTQTAGLAIGGYTTTTVANTEEYNGNGWITGGDLGTVTSSGAGAGTQTAGLAFGGNFPVTDVTQEYDGSSWTAGGNLGTGRYALGGAGTQTAGLAFGGRAQPTTTDATEEYNGSSWTAGGNMARTGDDRIRIAGAGLQTAAVGFGGNSAGNLTEEYNGTAWTSGGNLNTGRWSLGGCGIQTSALAFGGAVPPDNPQTATEKYDGSSWTVTGSLGTTRKQLAGAGSVPTGLAFGGKQTANLSSTEEFNISLNVITAAAWASQTNLPTTNYDGAGGAGTATAALVFGGFPISPLDAVKWNGSSWTSAGTLPTGQYFMATGGSQTAAFGAGGYGPTPSMISTTHEYDGSSWSTGGAYPGTIANFAGCGTQTAGLAFGGNPDPNGTSTNHYNGSSWTSSGTMSQNRDGHMSVGVQTAALAIGGYPQLSVVEQYNGSSWTSSPGSLITAVNNAGSAEQGSTSDAFIFGGNYASTPDGFSARTQKWDGTTWRTDANLGTGRREVAQGIGTTGAAFAAGGTTPPNTAAVEEYVPASTALNIKTITTS